MWHRLWGRNMNAWYSLKHYFQGKEIYNRPQHSEEIWMFGTQCSFQSIIFTTWKSILDKLLELPANYLNGLFYFAKITDFRIVFTFSFSVGAGARFETGRLSRRMFIHRSNKRIIGDKNIDHYQLAPLAVWFHHDNPVPCKAQTSSAK